MAELPVISAFATPTNEAPDRTKLRGHINSVHQDSPQRLGLALMHLNELYSAIDALAGLGHRLQVVEAENTAPLQFPKMLYNDRGEYMTVESSSEEKEMMKDGWRDRQEVSSSDETRSGELPSPETN